MSITSLEFSDLEDFPEVALTNSCDSNEEDIIRVNAHALTWNELLVEMERRGLRAKGFFEDDAQVLHAKVDEEFDA